MNAGVSQSSSPLEVVVLIGLQASGKSTFYRKRFAETHAHVSKDNFRNNPRPQRRLEQLVREALSAGRSVVVDNTNPKRADREAIIRIAREHGARVVGYNFERNTKASVARNAQREGKARVEDVAIFSTAKAMEFPSLSEGFDALYFVRMAPEHGFTIETWREPTESSGEAQ
jgi:predicted kinase